MGLLLSVVLLFFAGLRAGTMASHWSMVVTYLLSGAIGGLLLGACLPYARSRLGATLVGMLVLTPFCTALAVLDAFAFGDEALGWWGYVLMAIGIGGVAGYMTRDIVFRELDESPQADGQRRKP